MTSGGETPGIGGVPGLAKPVKRAPAAWSQAVRALHTDLPDSLRRSQRLRLRMRQLRRRRARTR